MELLAHARWFVADGEAALMIGVACAILASMCYGASDFFSGYASRKHHPAVVLLAMQSIGLPIMAAAALLFPGEPKGQAATLGFGAGICGAVGLGLLYHALAQGPMAAVAPTAALASAIVPVVGGLVLGQDFEWVLVIGVVAAAAAVLLLTTVGAEQQSWVSLVALEAVVAGALLGLWHVLLAQTGNETGLWPLVATRVAIMLAAAGAVAVLRLKRNPSSGLRAFAVLASLNEVAADITALIAVRESLIIAGPILALYPATTVLLACFVASENVPPTRRLGVVVAAVAVVALTKGAP
jgi:drug/metabolite transporter (DMT)-like permease